VRVDPFRGQRQVQSWFLEVPAPIRAGRQGGASGWRLVVDLVGHRSGVEPVRLPTLVDRAGTFASGGAPTLASVLVRSRLNAGPSGYPLGRAVRRPLSSAPSPPSPAAATPGTPSNPLTPTGHPPSRRRTDHGRSPLRAGPVGGHPAGIRQVNPRVTSRDETPRTRAVPKPSAGRYCAATVISRSIAHRCQLA
jgi:hypothetical protein